MEASIHNRHRKNRSHNSGLLLVLRDIALLIVVMNVFALFHHVLPMKLTPAGSKSVEATIAGSNLPFSQTKATAAAVSASASTAAVTPTIAPTITPTPKPVPGDFSATFPATDTGKDALYSYQTDTVRIAISRIQADGVTCFLADVYVKNMDAFETAFAKGTYGKSIYEFPTKTAIANGAVFAVTGDYYSARSKGIVVRNGTLYRDVPGDDVCVLYRNGEMKTYVNGALNLTDFDSQNVWQSWSFGPALLTENGEKISEFTSELNDRHPRCGIGYYAPGHYCFIVVDGRQKGYSIGVRLSEFSDLFANLGCKQAYNLDGGATAIMIFQGEVINKPYKGGRESGDIIYFV